MCYYSIYSSLSRNKLRKYCKNKIYFLKKITSFHLVPLKEKYEALELLLWHFNKVLKTASYTQLFTIQTITPSFLLNNEMKKIQTSWHFPLSTKSHYLICKVSRFFQEYNYEASGLTKMENLNFFQR